MKKKKSKSKIALNKLKKSYNPSSIFIISLGTFLVAFAYYLFFKPNGFVTGGVTGIANMLNLAVGIPDSYIAMTGNIILLIYGLFVLGVPFFTKTVFASLILPFYIFLLEIITNKNPNFIFNLIGIKNIPILDRGFNISFITSKYIISYIFTTIFGSLLSGIGLGLVFGAGTTTGGTDILQKAESKFLKFPISVAIYLTDGIIVLASVISFNIITVLFSIISVLLIGQVVDKVVILGTKGYTIFIITDLFDNIKSEIIKKLDRGLTKVSVSGGYTNKEKNLIICTVSKKEIHIIKNIIKECDPRAFSLIMETHEVVGDGFKRSDQ